MIDLSGKYIKTENNAESGRLLKMAIAQGYKTPIGEKAMENPHQIIFLIWITTALFVTQI